MYIIDEHKTKFVDNIVVSLKLKYFKNVKIRIEHEKMLTKLFKLCNNTECV